jgi:peptidoglycan L-alanyl-D-glutamate endopeptidase CwlK
VIPPDIPEYPHEFGTSSRRNLEGVLPDLVTVAELAIKLCEFDGKIIAGGGLRTEAQARANVANGTGILNSLHRRQSDGYGHAIDLIALTNGKIDWGNLKAFKAMARAVKIAAAHLCTPIRQGCDWNMNGTFGESREWDWPHFENPVEFWRPKAVAEMHRYRAELGMEPVTTDETFPGDGEQFFSPGES